MRNGAGGDRQPFTEPLMPTLVEKPPEGDGWIHEVKFDGYRSQIVRDAGGVRGAASTGLRNTGTSPKQPPSSRWKPP